ncbi:MAG TPA: hypothetical protein VGV64_06255 [Thermoplasmata archaeon]|nr:hypothetical protein [Thermoplasmata archaeon]
MAAPPRPQTPRPIEVNAPPQETRPTRAASNVARRLTGFLGRHPILCLLLLTPGIPEYLSGSSQLTLVVLNPIVFLLFLALNLGLYGPGVLLIREAAIRWRKGWATIILLGTAYSILEEGIALSTYFYPKAGPVGALGFYGHWLGVNWVWVAGIVMVHVVFSISLPILLHGYALPAWRGKSLLDRRGIRIAFLVLAADVVLLALLVRSTYQFFPGVGLIGASLVAILALTVLAYRVPATLLRPVPGPPRLPFVWMGAIGLALLPGSFLIEGIFGALHAPPRSAILALGLWFAAALFAVRRGLGDGSSVRHVLAFVLGALLSIMVIGLATEYYLPVVALADLAAFLLVWRLWRRSPGLAPAVPFWHTRGLAA